MRRAGILTAIVLAAVAATGGRSEAQTDGDALYRDLHPVFQFPSPPGAPDWTRPVFTKAGTPVCSEPNNLVGMGHWVVQHGGIDDVTTRDVFHCAVARAGLEVIPIPPPNAEEMIRGQTFEIVLVRWTLSDGNSAFGFVPVRNLQN